MPRDWQSCWLLGVASQSYLRAYLRAGMNVLPGTVILGESLSPAVLSGIVLALGGVVLINRSPG